MFFASDNSSPVHPNVIAALTKANEGYASPYGADPTMDDVRQMIRDRFEAPEAAVYLVATGTAANVLSLSIYCPPWGTVFCHPEAHIQVDECGGPEFYTGGGKLVPVDGKDAKIDPDLLQAAIERTGQGDVHSVQRGMLSITNVTECGSVYTADEVARLCDIAKSYDMPVHLDGARFANALVAAKCSAADMTWKAGVDVLSFGGTKNGLMAVEAVVIFDPAKAWEFELRRKRGGHLFSKHRYLSAQMQAYLQDDLWLDMARRANRSGAKLSKGLTGFKGAKLLHPTQANMVFATWPRAGHRRAKDAGAAYNFWPHGVMLDGPEEDVLGARLVTSWSTTDADIEHFLNLITG